MFRNCIIVGSVILGASLLALISELALAGILTGVVYFVIHNYFTRKSEYAHD
jgi:hypothetical protein